MERIIEIIRRNPIIAACSEKNAVYSVESAASMVILLHGSLTWLVKPEYQQLKEKKPVFVHTDLIKGLGGDKESIVFLRDFIGIAGIITTKSTLIRAARKEGVPAIQRIFLIDSASLSNSIDSIKENKPDAVEIMPGIATGIFRKIREAVDVPVIAAGLIKTKEEISAALAAGADAVSMSTDTFWNETSFMRTYTEL